MWPKVSCSSIHYGTPKSLTYCPHAAYAEFLEDRHKLYGDLDDHSRWRHNHSQQVYPSLPLKRVQGIWVF